MVDGTYKIDIDTLLGKKDGSLVLRSEGDKVIASIDAPLIGKQETEGVLDGDTFTAEGVFKTRLLGKISYSLKGEVVGDDLTINISSSKGDIALTGKRQ